MPADKKQIENLNIPFHAVTTDLVTGQPYVVSKGNLARAMQASSAIPVLRRPISFDDGLLVDGAIVANVPCEQARDLKADFIIAVDVDEHLLLSVKDHFRKIDSVAPRIEQIYLARADANQLKLADIIIHPKVNGIGVLSLKAKDAKNAIAAGEQATRDVIPELKAKLNLLVNQKTKVETSLTQSHLSQ